MSSIRIAPSEVVTLGNEPRDTGVALCRTCHGLVGCYVDRPEVAEGCSDDMRDWVRAGCIIDRATSEWVRAESEFCKCKAESR